MKATRQFSTKVNWDSTLNLPQTSLPIRATLNDAVYKEQVSSKLYETLSARTGAPKFNLTDGPPFANGDLHVGKPFLFNTPENLLIILRSRSK